MSTAKTFSKGATSRLTARDLGRFSGASLFDRIGRAVCAAGCLPRKELYEAWEVARRARRWIRGGRVVDAAGGHGLLAHLMLILDDSSPSAVVVDPNVPKSAAAVHEALTAAWPRLRGRVTWRAEPLEAFDVLAGDVVVSSHACGRLTDGVIDAAIEAAAFVAVLPCCHDLGGAHGAHLAGWVDGALAMDIARAERLRAAGYDVRTQTIPSEITPKNRLLMGRNSHA